MKAELKSKPYTLITLMLVIAIISLGVGMRNAERPYMHVSGFQWNYISNSFWCVFIMVTTIGYGDIYPRTHIGRLIGVVSFAWGTFLISLMVLALTISVQLTNEQRKAKEMFLEGGIKSGMASNAANAIKFALKFWVELRKRNMKLVSVIDIPKNDKSVLKFKEAIIAFRKLRIKLIRGKNHTSEDLVFKIRKTIPNTLEKLIPNLKHLHIFSQKFEKIEVHQAILAQSFKLGLKLIKTIVNETVSKFSGYRVGLQPFKTGSLNSHDESSFEKFNELVLQMFRVPIESQSSSSKRNSFSIGSFSSENKLSLNVVKMQREDQTSKREHLSKTPSTNGTKNKMSFDRMRNMTAERKKRKNTDEISRDKSQRKLETPLMAMELFYPSFGFYEGFEKGESEMTERNETIMDYVEMLKKNGKIDFGRPMFDSISFENPIETLPSRMDSEIPLAFDQ